MGNSKSHLSAYEEGSLEIDLSNFKLLRVVGKGSYGKVRTLSPYRLIPLQSRRALTREGPRC